ncbi:hypothetical protein MC885_012385 [Smutsia gigantea]|nr:hypothetical protein MC885_012385 [Smutsia gigantea]
MLFKTMPVYSATVIRAVLDQLCYSSVLEYRFEATQMLKTTGLEQIQAQGWRDLHLTCSGGRYIMNPSW